MKSLKSMFLIGALVCISVSTFAQGQGGRKGQQKRAQGPNIEQMKKSLDLSDEQVEALKPIFADAKTQMDALREKEFDSREARQEAVKAIKDSQKEKIETVLTEEQVQKMEELQKKRQERGRGRRGGGQ